MGMAQSGGKWKSTRGGNRYFNKSGVSARTAKRRKFGG